MTVTGTGIEIGIESEIEIETSTTGAIEADQGRLRLSRDLQNAVIEMTTAKGGNTIEMIINTQAVIEAEQAVPNENEEGPAPDQTRGDINGMTLVTVTMLATLYQRR